MITIFQVDAFTGSPFKGNPAGVCITEKALDDISMRNIAAEMNLSETAFAVPADSRAIDAAGRFSLRWFTPKCEVNLCGHATLAVAKVLYRIYNVRREHIIFETRSGELEISRKADFIQLDFPSGAPRNFTRCGGRPASQDTFPTLRPRRRRFRTGSPPHGARIPGRK